jgi:hypothetical protein
MNGMLTSTAFEGKQAENIVLSMPFWTRVENWLRASQPLLIALRIAGRDEIPAAPEIMVATDVAKSSIKEALKENPNLLKEVMVCYEKRRENQMEQQLCGVVLGIFNAHGEIRKRTDTDVAFTREYSRVSISTGNVKCTRESRPSKDKDKRRKIYIFLTGREELFRVF